MRDKIPLITQTTQPCSRSTLNDPGKDLTINKPETEDNMDLLLSIYDGLNNIYEMLIRLDYLLERKDIKQILYPKGKGEKK